MQLQQQLQALAVGHPQANGLARGVAHAAGHFLGGFEDEGVGARRAQLEQAVLAVVHPRIVGQLRQVAAQQGEVVFFVHLADAAQAVYRVLVVQVADQRVAGVRGHGHDAALLQQQRGLLEQPGLRVVGMGFEVLGHGAGSQ